MAAQQQNPVMGPGGGGGGRGTGGGSRLHINYHADCNDLRDMGQFMYMTFSNICKHVSTVTNCFFFKSYPLNFGILYFTFCFSSSFSRQYFRDLAIVRQQFMQSFLFPCRAFVQSDHKALFINTVFNIDQICQRYSCSEGTFLGTEIIICLQ